jgi:hypothetical protein
MRETRRFPFFVAICLLVAGLAFAEELTPKQKTEVEAKVKQLAAWSTDVRIVGFVRDFNANPPAETRGMTQEKWAGLNMLSPEIKAILKNELTTHLRALKSEDISEIFVSGIDGTKAAFLAKTTNWSHRGKPKHDVPLSGKPWIGKPEIDNSTGISQVQIGLPVLDGGKPIGSIVVGLNLASL